MSLNKPRTFVEWLAVGVPLLAAVGVLAIVTLHVGSGIAWTDASGAVVVLVLIQVILFSAMFWLRKPFNATSDFRPGIIASGVYILVMGLVAMHYAARWGWMSTAEIRRDYLGFSMLTAIGTLACAGIFALFRKS